MAEPNENNNPPRRKPPRPERFVETAEDAFQVVKKGNKKPSTINQRPKPNEDNDGWTPANVNPLG